MYEFFKSEVYYKLISSLYDLEEFYTNSYSNPYRKNKLPSHDANTRLSIAENLIENIIKIKLTTPEKDLSNYINFIAEVRENILQKISHIPIYIEAKKIYIKRFEDNLQSEKIRYDIIGIDEPITIYELDGYDPVAKSVSLDEILKMWKNGLNIGSLEFYEEDITKICLFFALDRKFIGPDKRYLGINLVKTTDSFDPDKLAIELINKEYLGQMHKRPFINLICGKTYFEPIQWKGNLSELNKLIKTMYSFSNKSLENVSIDWKTISKIFLVNNEFPESDKLKGASNAKVGNAKDLYPFWSYLNLSSSQLRK